MNNRILPAIALFVAAGIFFAYVNPTWSGSIADMKLSIAQDDQALSAAKDYSNKQNSLASARSAINQEDLARISKFLPDSVDNVGLILDINALAARSGLSLANIDVAANDINDTKGAKDGAGVLPSASNPIGSINLSLSAIGTFASFQSFLSGIEKSARLLDMQDITVKGSDTGVYNYQMTVRLYWLR